MATPAYGATLQRHLDDSVDAARRRLRGLDRGQQGVRQQQHPQRHDATHRSSTAGLASYGMSGNFGQPSVVYRAPIRLDDVTTNATGTADQIQGYNCGPPLPGTSGCDWTGSTGTIMPPDATITTGVPGLGRGAVDGDLGPRRHRPRAGLGGELLAGFRCRRRHQ